MRRQESLVYQCTQERTGTSAQLNHRLNESTFMRSSKSRSRGKNRNNRPSGGNIINRVFDSSGPDGKVRGTPQQIIDKYNQLHRDAQLSGDRVAAENFAQHAEHYLRMLAEAQREMDKAREEQEEENRRRQAERDRERAERLKAQEAVANGSEGTSQQPADQQNAEPENGDSTLVETPESQPKPKKPRALKPRAPKSGSSSQDGSEVAPAEEPQASE